MILVFVNASMIMRGPKQFPSGSSGNFAFDVDSSTTSHDPLDLKDQGWPKHDTEFDV
jgi:hypothetical protein